MTSSLPIRLATGSVPSFGVDDLTCAAATLLGFAELMELVPLQPYGVLTTTEAYE